MGGESNEDDEQQPALGQPLPSADAAVIDKEKLLSYALDPESPRGQHKAAVFRGALDIEKSDAEYLPTRVAPEKRQNLL